MSKPVDPLPFRDAVQRKRSTGPGGMAEAFAQEGDGGVTVSLLNTLDVQITDRTAQYAATMDPHLALDVAQRLIQVANVALVKLREAEKGATPVAQPKPKIDIVRGALPPNLRRG